MDPWIFPSSIDGMLIEFDPSSSYPNSVNGPALSGESVSSNYMELEEEESPNDPPPPNPNPISSIPYFTANANLHYFHFYQMNQFFQLQNFYQMNLFFQLQDFYQMNLFFLLHFHYLSGQPLFPIPIPWVPMYVPFIYMYIASIYPIGGEVSALVPPSTAPTGPADVSEGLSPPFF